jgi:hypothetical protein
MLSLSLVFVRARFFFFHIILNECESFLLKWILFWFFWSVSKKKLLQGSKYKEERNHDDWCGRMQRRWSCWIVVRASTCLLTILYTCLQNYFFLSSREMQTRMSARSPNYYTFYFRKNVIVLTKISERA